MLLRFLLQAVAFASALSGQPPAAGDWPDTLVKRRGGRPGRIPCSPPALSLMGHGFKRFEWVTSHLAPGDKLARSSVPHYSCGDGDQALTDDSIQFLKKKGVVHVISMNSCAYSWAIASMLKANGIAYTPLPLEDYETSRIHHLNDGIQAFRAHRSGATLIWCGYGHGRTGVMVSAIQIARESEKPEPTDLTLTDYRFNNIETSAQIALLNRLQTSLKPGGAQELFRSAVAMFHEAATALKRFQARPLAQARLATHHSIEEASEAIIDASDILESRLELSRAIFDRFLALTPASSEDFLSLSQELVDNLRNQVQSARGRAFSVEAVSEIAEEITDADVALRELSSRAGSIVARE